MLTQRSGPEFTILGNVITIRLPWAIAAAAALLWTAIETAPSEVAGSSVVLWYANAALVVVASAGSLLLHEVAHALVGRRMGRGKEHISVYPLGGVSDDFNAPGTPRQETLVAIAGPIASLIAGGVFAGAWAVSSPALTTARNDLLFLAAFNVTLGAVNLLPGYPLDGGRIFRALVWYLHDDFTVGTRASVTYGQVISTFALASGLVILGSRSSWSLAGIWIILAAWGVARVGRQETTRSMLLSAGGSLTAGEIVRGLNAHVRPDQPLDEVLETLLANVGSGPGLVTDQGQVVGVIALPNLRRYRRADWSRTTAREAMIPIDRLRTMDESTSVRRLLNELMEGSADSLLITGAEGVVGALDRQVAIEKLIERIRPATQTR